MKLSMIEHGKKLENVVEFSRYFSRIRENIWRIIIVAIVTALVAYPLIRMITAKYVATSVLTIKALQDDTTPIPQLGKYDSTRSDFYETQYAQVQSRVVLERAISALRLDEEPTFNGGFDNSTEANAAQRRVKTLKNLVNGLTVTGVRNTQLIDISFESPSAQQAARVANGVAQAYIDYSVEQKKQATDAAQRWNQQQMDTLKQQMVGQKAAIDAWLKQQGLLTFRGVDGFETEELGIVTNRLADATQRRVAAQSQYDLVRQALAKNSLEEVISIPEISGHAQIQDLRIALIQTRRALAELRKRYGPKHDKILAAQAQVQAVNGQIGQVLRELAEGARQQYQAALDDENNYRAMLERQKGDFQQLAGKRDAYNTMVADLSKTEELYKSLYQRAHEQALALSLNQPDAQISDPAVAPERPAKPNKALLLVLAVVLVELLYIAYLIVSAARDNTINSMSQLAKRLNLNVLGEVPKFTGAGGHRALAGSMLHNTQDAEIVHALRTNIMLSDPSPQVLVIASAQGREGRTLLAEVLAHSWSADQKTLLIDLDYSNEGGLSDGAMPGVAEVIQGKQTLESVLIARGENLTFLPRGKLSGSASLMLTSAAMTALLTTLRQRFQRIIIDSAALQQARDGQLIGRQADGVLLVVQAGRTQTGSLFKATETLRAQHNPLMGAVLNQVEDKNLESNEGLRALNSHIGELITPTKQP